MESKNVKVIDEHGIDRNANIICAFDLAGSDYVVYWIERDTENDNIFVSKVIKNLDGTSNMLNIDDSMEKEKISEVVRELVKYAVGTEADKLAGDSFTLPSGKGIKINSVLFNKEQSINVQRTYITTVKKSVTKVSEDFYKINLKNEVQEEDVKPVIEVHPVASTVVDPIAVTTPEPIVESVVPEVAPVLPVEEVTSIVEPVVAPVVSESATTLTAEESKVEPVEVAPVLPVKPVSELQTEEVVVPVVSEVAPVLPVEEVKEEAISVVEPVIPPVVSETVTTPTVEEPKVEPVEVATSNTLVFDGSKESNLNKALGEVSVDVPSVADIAPVREFGVEEEVKIIPEMAPTVQPEPVVKEDAKVLTKKMGFANNKFFMAIAIVFFMASCVFLGYEVFQFFQLR